MLLYSPEHTVIWIFKNDKMNRFHLDQIMADIIQLYENEMTQIWNIKYTLLSIWLNLYIIFS